MSLPSTRTRPKAKWVGNGPRGRSSYPGGRDSFALNATADKVAATRWRHLAYPSCTVVLVEHPPNGGIAGELRGQIEPLLESLQADSSLCLESEDFIAAAHYAAAIEAGGYTQALLDLAQEAQAMVEGE